jgi:hypothetical protein
VSLFPPPKKTPVPCHGIHTDTLYRSLANVVGTEEPIYGPSAIKSVAEDAQSTPYTELTRDDMKWVRLDQTSVESQSFYLMADSGHFALAQVIYSNVV